MVLDLTVTLDRRGEYSYRSNYDGNLVATPVDVTSGQPVPAGAPYNARVTGNSAGSHRKFWARGWTSDKKLTKPGDSTSGCGFPTVARRSTAPSRAASTTIPRRRRNRSGPRRDPWAGRFRKGPPRPGGAFQRPLTSTNPLNSGGAAPHSRPFARSIRMPAQ
jgi:hypothetical protein